MKYLFIKAGGSGNIEIKQSNSTHNAWLSYRNISISVEHYEKILFAIKNCSTKYKIGFSLGGVGAFLFIDFARRLGANNMLLNSIGCKIINLNTYTLLNWLVENNANVCPHLVSAEENLKLLFAKYDICLFEANDKYTSSDSSVAIAASQFNDSTLLYFKAKVSDRLKSFSLQRNDNIATKSAQNDPRKKHTREPKSDPLIDMEALNIINESKIHTLLCDKKWVSEFNSIIKGQHLKAKIYTIPIAC